MLRLILSVFALFTLLTGSAHANPVRIESVEAELISGNTVIKAGEPFWAALVLRLDPHWHTYWVNPGDSGYAAQIEWQLPEGFTAGDFQWPTPKRIPTPPLMSYGYETEVVLPVKITPPATLTEGQVYRVGGDAHWLMCKDICLPGDTPLYLDITAGAEADAHPVFGPVIQTTLSRMPANPLGLTAEVAYTDKDVTLTVTSPDASALPGDGFMFIPATEGVIQDSEPQKTTLENGVLTLTMPRDTFNLLAPKPLDGLLVSDSGLTVAKISAQPASTAPAPVPDAHLPANIWVALLMAFIGGLILNLMPCVLPVLSIKVLHLMHHSKKRDGWKHGLAFTLGVSLTFMALVAVLAILKSGGSHIGWGFQLQSPAFVSALAVVLTVVALDLFGVFEIGLSLTRAGNAFDDRKGVLGSLLTGVLATVVATPCTAPFMGSAVAYSLTQSTATTLLVFLALGFGLSAPYLILTTFPALLKFVPKPGAWMDTFKQLLGFPVMATVVWLGWVLSLQTSTDAVALLMFMLLATAFVLWVYGKAQRKGTGLVWSAVVLAALLGLTYFGGQAIGRFEGVNTTPVAHGDWQPYSREKLTKLNTLKRPVLVVYTAAWCITCKVNERLVLRAPETLKLFADNGVEVLVADWTKRDAAIADELAKFGRNGVPFYVYYPPNGSPKPLPELITYETLADIITHD